MVRISSTYLQFKAEVRGGYEELAPILPRHRTILSPRASEKLTALLRTAIPRKALPAHGYTKRTYDPLDYTKQLTPVPSRGATLIL